MQRLTKLLVGGFLGLSLFSGLTACQRTPAAPTPSKKAAVTQPVRPLTVAEVQRDHRLRDVSLIYYAVKHTGVQRWQEVSDFKLGWQVETETVHGTKRYSVWPDAHIQESQKKLEPNWFTLKGQRVTYESFVVHSDGDYTVAHTTLPRVVRQINRDHAARRVRHMTINLTTLEK